MLGKVKTLVAYLRGAHSPPPVSGSHMAAPIPTATVARRQENPVTIALGTGTWTITRTKTTHTQSPTRNPGGHGGPTGIRSGRSVTGPSACHRARSARRAGGAGGARDEVARRGGARSGRLGADRRGGTHARPSRCAGTTALAAEQRAALRPPQRPTPSHPHHRRSGAAWRLARNCANLVSS